MTFQQLERLFRLFNRKERYHLLCAAQGEPIKLGECFLSKLGVPLNEESIYVAMDYHLDWLSAILVLLKSEESYGKALLSNNSEDLIAAIEEFKPFPNSLAKNDRAPWAIEGNQQDIDLLVLGEDKNSEDIHLILIEAKFDGGWTNKQLDEKGRRIGELIPNKAELDLPGGGKLSFHWRFAGLKENMSTQVNILEKLKEIFPGWGDVKYIQYFPEGCSKTDLEYLLKPVRTDPKGNGKSKTYTHWTLERVGLKK